MKKLTIIVLFITLFVGVASIASAKTYQCANIPLGLRTGSRGNDVLRLQQFLVDQHYPGGGSWMLTGLYGRATTVAVTNFQRLQNLPETGKIDAGTLSSIARVSCNSASGNTSISNYNYTPNYNYKSPTNSGAIINYLMSAMGAVGSTVTVIGSGFSQGGNAVHFGVGVIANLFSNDGKSLSFTIPQTLAGYGTQTVTPGTYNVSVITAQGATSNSVPYTVTAYAAGSVPAIESISGPTSLSLNSQGIWTVVANGHNNTQYTTSVRWGDEALYAVSNSQTSQTNYGQGSQSLSFTHTYQTVGTYNVIFTVTNAIGQSSVSSVTVYVTGSISLAPVSVNLVSPLQGRVGTMVTLRGNGFTPYGNAIHFGNGGVVNVASTNSGTTLSFIIPTTVSPCDIVGSSCAAPSISVTPGTYGIYVSNANGQSNAYNFVVTP